MTKRLTIIAALCAASMPALASAQTSPAAAAPDQQPAAAPENGLDDIVVTAQRRTERLQSVPIAVSVLTPTTLTNNGVHSLQDLGATVPGFVATKSAGYGAAPLSIRGIGGANGGGNFFADEPVATYIDGVYVGRLSVATSDIVDLDGIQILRGPQGTLYGRNSTAGAILIATKRPTNDLEGQVNASIDTIGNERVEAAVGGPVVSDVLQARIAGAYADHQGWGRNVVTGRRTNNGRDITIRGSLRFVPTSDITIDLIGEHADQHFAPGLFRVAKVTGGAADSPYVLRPDFNQAMQNNQYSFDENNYSFITNNSVNLSAEYRGEAVTVNSISAYRTFDVDGLADSDNTAPADLTGGPLRSFNSARLRNKQFTQELRFSSPQADSRFKWTVGGFYIHEDNAVAPFVIQTSTAYFGLGTNATFNATQKLDAYAGFGDVSYELVKGLTIRLGGRYSYETKVFDVTQQVVTLVGGVRPVPPPPTVLPAGYVVAAPPPFHSQASFENFSGRAVVDYQITHDVLAYASFSQGFKSGGFNAFGLVPAFKPETVNAYEIGLKTELFDHLLRFNTDAFLYDYDNLQTRQGVTTGGVSIVNAGRARIKGVEVESTLAPMQGLKLGLNVTYLDARFLDGTLQRVPLAATYKFGANLPLETVNLAGNWLSRAPRWQLGGTADYQTAVSRTLKLSLGGSVRYQTNVYYSETQQAGIDTFRSGAWAEVGVRVTLAEVGDRWNVGLFGENINDNRHLTQITPLSSFPYGTLNEPRRFGLRTAVKF
jgi:iron complex outermembrane receptor protein